MRSTAKRLTSLLLAALMAAGTLFTAVSCADTQDADKESATSAETVGATAPGETTPSGAESGTVTETETVPAYDTVEKEKFNREFVFLTRKERLPDMYVEEITNDLLDDSIYERNVKICEDFGITLDYVTTDCAGDQVAALLQRQVSSNLDEFDAFFGNKLAYNSCVTGNYCYNLSQVNALGLDNPWWDQNCYENLSVGGKTYVLNGDINPFSMIMASCFVYNKSLMEDMGKSVTTLNDLARDGEWTLDAFLQYTQDATADLNGDGVIDVDNDRYCFSAWSYDAPYSMFYGAGGLFVENVNGTPELTYKNEDIIAIYEKIFDIVVGAKANYASDLADYNKVYDIFADGRALFCDVTLGKIELYFSEKDINYGILPVPKYDAAQEDYISFINGATGLVMMAKTEKDPAFAGTILEAMAAYNYDNVTPNLFRVVTKLQTAQDPESSAMVDIILRNTVYDLGYFCDFEITNLVRDQLAAGDAEIAAALKRKERVTAKALTALMESFEKCD